ncbi:DNA-processing protein DprA [Gordonia soli]|nr:DNA-processing protein DprA [Gordonia soli]
MTSSTEEQRAWAYLSGVAEPPSAAVRALIAAIGVIEAAQAIGRRRVPAGHESALDASSGRWEVVSGAADLDAAARVGARLITPDDPEWPAWSLLALEQSDTAVRGGEPLALWARGPARLDDVCAASTALVGSRAASAYGEHVTSRLAAGLVLDGWTVISGGAFGIDGSAHRAALAAGGATVAVLACGIDRDYPAAHSRLLSEIAETGVVVSEYAPGTTAAKHRFLTRNRLVAALSQAVVVVEAGRRSGAANTAAWARKLGRPLGAVPGPVTSATSVGCHRMIADQLATLVTCAADIVAMAAPDGRGDELPRPVRGLDRLSADQRRVRDAIPARGVVTIEEIGFSAGMDPAQARRALAEMDVLGVVVGDSGGWRLP